MTHDVARLVHEVIESLHLDLQGLTVLTEAATGHYAATAAIAAAAGAEQIIAIAGDSPWGGAADAEQATRSLVTAVEPGAGLTLVRHATPDVLGTADLITNLGFVRPLDEQRLRHLKPTAVISLMCESWEARPADIDVDACRRHGIVVLGTNEHTPEWPLFSYSGPLAIQMLFDAGMKVSGSKVAVLGRDNFAPVIASALRDTGARVSVDRDLTRTSSRVAMDDADAIVVADYASDDVIVGPRGLVRTEDVADVAPNAVIVQFAGAVDDTDLRARGFDVWPDPVVPARRMSRTFAALGPKPVIELHAAGLLVGATAARLRLQGMATTETIDTVCRKLPLAMPPAGHPAAVHA
jgi:hypothetical protein